MLTINSLTVRFGGRVLFKNISFFIGKKDRIGLTGKNGAGKSTLLKILSGNDIAKVGSIVKAGEVSIGYLPQEITHKTEDTVLEETKKAFNEINLLEEKLASVQKSLEQRTDYESNEYLNLIEELNELNHKMTLFDPHKIEEKIELILKGLGFERSDFSRKLSEFSGGWRMRVELAKILLTQPNLLLLDEPTNHLDMESIQWLEQFLASYHGSIVLISHDKIFLDNLTNRTIEISNSKIYDYKANYSKYLVLREDEVIRQIQTQKNQEKFIKHTEELINKFRAKKNKAAFAQTLIKKLDRIEKIEIDALENKSLNFRFPPVIRSGKEVLKAKIEEKSFDTQIILKNISISLSRGEKIALVGKNGTGKTTLIKMLLGDEDFEGEVEKGHNVSIGYFAQNQTDLLDKKKTILQTIEEEAKGDMFKQARNILGSFLFSGEDVEKKVSVLSGGEKTRLSMCKLLLEPYNFLVLDEPTNHLDIDSREILKEALQLYDGTLLIVSHDRSFLEDLTDRIYEVKDQGIKFHHGGIKEFIEKKGEDWSTAKLSTNQNSTTIKVNKSSDNKQAYLKRKEKEKNLRKLQNKTNKLELEISDIERKLEELDVEILENAGEGTNDELYKQYAALKKQLDERMAEWESCMAQLES